MKGNRAVLTAVVLLVLIIAGWWLFKQSNRGPSIDLIATFDAAQKRPAGGTFSVTDADLNGDKKRAIFTAPPSRIIWKVRIPDDGWLMVSLGMKPESWDKEGRSCSASACPTASLRRHLTSTWIRSTTRHRRWIRWPWTLSLRRRRGRRISTTSAPARGTTRETTRALRHSGNRRR